MRVNGRGTAGRGTSTVLDCFESFLELLFARKLPPATYWASRLIGGGRGVGTQHDRHDASNTSLQTSPFAVQLLILSLLSSTALFST